MIWQWAAVLLILLAAAVAGIAYYFGRTADAWARGHLAGFQAGRDHERCQLTGALAAASQVTLSRAGQLEPDWPDLTFSEISAAADAISAEIDTWEWDKQ